MAVERGDGRIVDVEGEDDDGGEGGCSAEDAELLEVCDAIGAAVGAGLVADGAAEAEVFEFAEALDEGEREEEEDGEGTEPRGDEVSGGGGAGEQAV